MYSARPNLNDLQNYGSNPSFIRNVCILAHVDHGKTTISDSLLAVNGLVSKRSAGKVRYLDDRLDEQQRGITMKSSAVSLCVPFENTKYVTNLIDTPGHIDFSTEVAAAVRICDGALIIVDVVEGVCVQTKDAIKQAYDEQTKMILIVNKIDRLIVELHKSVEEIFQAILRVIEDCNVTIAELCRFDLANEGDEEEFLFSPEKDNVIFASAVDGWGVTTKLISNMFYHVIFGETPESLNEKMWNFDYYVDSSTKKIVTGGIEKRKENLFVQLCLKTIYYVYFTLMIRMEREKVDVILRKLKIHHRTREMHHNDPRVQVKAILQAWSSLASIILAKCIQVIPSPLDINERKIRHLIYGNRCFENDKVNECCEKMIKWMKDGENSESSLIGYVSKMFCVNKKDLSQNKAKTLIVPRPRNIGEDRKEETKTDEAKAKEAKTEKADPKVETKTENQDEEKYEKIEKVESENIPIGLCRVFSGTLRVGQEVYLLNNTYLPSEVDSDKTVKFKIKELYIMLGRELLFTDSVSYGNICGIGGLEDAVLRTGTLSSTLECLALTEYSYMEPIVRNTIEPVNPRDIPSLHKGLKLLMQSDSCVQSVVQDSGEHVLLTAGDVHLAKCLEDLKNKFINFDVNVSKPMVALRETIISSSRRIDLKDPTGCVDILIPEYALQFQVIAIPLCDNISTFIKSNYDIFRMIEEYQNENGNSENADSKEKYFKNEYTRNLVIKSKEQLMYVLKASAGIWTDLHDRIWSISKMKNGINILFNNTEDYETDIFNVGDKNDERRKFDCCFLNGFEMCCRAGPICDEPLTNCAFFVNKYELNSKIVIQSDQTLQMVPYVTLAVKTAMKEAFMKQQQRLMEPIFTTDIQVNTSILGKVYSVINKRQGKVLEAIGMDDKEKTFMVTAELPVIESDGFANEIRKTTSGQANPSLRFSHYEIIDGDPYYDDEEAIEDSDDDTFNTESAIRANKLMKEVRKRKGLLISEQVVVHAEKQRTLNKKK